MPKARVKLEATLEQAQKDLDKFNKRMGKQPHVVVGVPADASAYPDGTSVLLSLIHI